MNKHIPGPWTAHEPDEELDKYHWTIRAPGTREGMVSFEVARISGKNNDTDANTARLIAAAPELLAALQWYEAKAVQMGRAAIHQDSKLMLALMKEIAVEYGAQARTAIAKATGEKG